MAVSIEFWDPLHIFGTVGARKCKFGNLMQIDHLEH